MDDKSLIEEAQQAAKRLEIVNAKTEELVKRQEAIEARRLLGGQSNAGEQKPELSPEEKTKVDMKNYFKGTIIGDALDKRQ